MSDGFVDLVFSEGGIRPRDSVLRSARDFVSRAGEDLFHFLFVPLDDTHPHAFPTTHWSLVSRVRSGGESAEHAMEEICARYWYPIYAFIRRRGYDRADAEDLTQSFFERLIRRELVQAADRDKGRLRNFILEALSCHLTDAHRRVHAEKRGAGITPVPIEWDEAEQRYSVEPTDESDPEKLYLLAWARGLLSGVRERMRAAFESSDRAGMFATIEPYLAAEEDHAPYRDLAAVLVSTEGATRLLVMRLRRKFRDLVEEEIARTVADPGDIPGELAWLRGVLATG